MNTEIDEICRRVIGAMIDGGCRGLLIVAVVWGALKLLPRVNAATRHGAWFAVLLILVALPVVEFWDSRKPVVISGTVEGPVEKAPAMMIEDFVPIEEPETVYVPETIAVEAEALDSPRRAEDVAPYLWEVSLPLYIATILVGGWISLAFVRVVGLIWQLCVLGGISRRALAAPADLKAICGEICREMRFQRTVKLLFSSEISAPMVIGFLNPRVLIPQEIAGENIAPVLRHELAHVARWDDWANLVQQILKAIFFFHPGVLIASRRLTAEREIACDDHALAALRAPKDYALFLTEFAGRMRGRDFAAAPAAWSSNSQLKERIVMILDGKRNASPRLDRARFGAMTAGAVALALVTLAAGPRVAFADNDEPKIKAEVAVEPKVEAAVEVAPAVAATPSVSVTIPAVAVTPAIAADVVPVADVPGAPRPPRAPRIGGGGDDIERRLERLERMVESLMGGDKMKIKPGPHGSMGMPMPAPAPKPPIDHFHSDFSKEFHKNFEKQFKLDFDHGKIAKKATEDARREVDRARVEVERAKREMERGKREGEWARERAQLEQERAGKQRDQAERQREQAEKQISQDRRSLERERQALEEQRRSIEKRIESLERQMQKRNAENKSDDSEPKEKK